MIVAQLVNDKVAHKSGTHDHNTLLAVPSADQIVHISAQNTIADPGDQRGNEHQDKKENIGIIRQVALGVQQLGKQKAVTQEQLYGID